MIQTLIVENFVYCPYSQISMRILSLSLFHTFVNIKLAIENSFVATFPRNVLQ